jgi:hypothetical protein
MPLLLIFAAFALLTVAYTLTSLAGAKTSPPKAALEGEFSFPQAQEGKPHIVVFGDVWLEDWHVIWWGNLRTTPITQDSGGKKGK